MRYLISLICIALLLWGCDNSTKVPAKPLVVRKKIVAPQNTTPEVGRQKTLQTAETKPAAKAPSKPAPGAPSKKVVAKVDKPRVDAKSRPRATVVRKKIVMPNNAKGGKKKTIQTAETKPATKAPSEPATTAPSKKVEAKVDKSRIADQSQPAAKPVAQPAVKKDTVPRTLIADKDQTGPIHMTKPGQPLQKKPAIKPKAEITPMKLAAKPQQSSAGGPKTAAVKKSKATPPATASKATASTMRPGVVPATYDPTGKIDPFEPLFREKPEITRKKKQIKRTPRTPLERIDLSQLKLVGIITAASGNRALVEESSGKGYVIKNGTYIGTNGGKIVQIQKEVVTVEEKFEDVFGKIQTRKRELKLPKPPGEF